ncbi:MAG: Unknown protein [uncultured Thiotrichaceae bacterium]|uniref:Zinc-finger domain-containing protein n=1 Tax=uncultured Thiotrichaceae bacterium TaxID=298394 RepID=A0A6S6U7P2_9GAMM|nr:MAG: Unknown protein [uncultured Thiotrichaceae bacterium]
MNSHESGNLVDEARLLMPWYLTNKLSSEEQRLVNEALEQSPELRGEFLQEEKMMRLVKENKRLLELTALDTTEQRLDKMLSRIQHEEQQQTQIAKNTAISKRKEKAEGWLGKFFRSGLFGNDWLSPANAVFASLLVCQLGVMGYMQLSSSAPEGVVYESASVSKVSAGQAGIKKSTVTFLVEFQDDAPHGEVCDFLNTWSARIVSGPDNQNMFSVELSTDSTTDVAALADNIMQQATAGKAPLSFIGPQFRK